MDMNNWAKALLDTIAIMSAMSNRSDSESISLVVVDDIVEFVLERGESKFIIPLSVNQLTERNVMDVIAHITTLASMEHAGSVHSNKTVH